MLERITLEQALDLMLEKARPLETVTVDLLDAVGMAAGEEVRAAWDLPSFDRSPLDGYALRAADTAPAGGGKTVELEMVERIHAGYPARRAVGPGTAIALDTGAPIPPGADCVIRLEETVVTENGVRIRRRLASGENVIRAGEDIKAGETAVRTGQRIDGAVVGLLAGLGLDRVKVFRKPRVAVFATGNEFADRGGPPAFGRIHLSNPYALAGCVRELGCQARLFASVPDDRARIAAGFGEAMACCEVVLSSGGTSMGDRDVVGDALSAVGAEPVFRQVRLKPGSQVVLAQKDGRFVVNLSGNRSAAWIAFLLLVRPLLLRLAGFNDVLPVRVKGIMAQPFAKNSPQRRFLMVRAEWRSNGYLAALAGWQSPASLRAPALGNALVDIPAGHGPLAAGDEVDILLLQPNNNGSTLDRPSG